jgi:aquaporin Z
MAKTAISSNESSTTEQPKAETSKSRAMSGSMKSMMLAGKIKESLKNTPIIGSCIAEFIGTFLFVISFFQMQSSPLFVAFAVVGIFLMVSGTSGIYINPAVTVGAWITRRVSSLRAVSYIMAQSFGAAAAWMVLKAFIDNSGTSTGATLFHAATLTEANNWYIFFAELLGSTILAFGFAAALKQRRNRIVAAFVAGMAVLIGLYIAMSFTTALLSEQYTAFSFLNPIVAIAANGLSWNIWPIAVYIFAPILGGVIGFVLQDALKYQTHENARDCECCSIKK